MHIPSQCFPACHSWSAARDCLIGLDFEMVMWYQNPWSRQQCASKLPVGSTLTLNRDHSKRRAILWMWVLAPWFVCPFPFLSFSFLFLSFPMWNGDAIPGCAQSGCRMQYKVACSTTTYSTKASLVDFFFVIVLCIVQLQVGSSWPHVAQLCLGLLHHATCSPCHHHLLPTPQ